MNPKRVMLEEKAAMSFMLFLGMSLAKIGRQLGRAANTVKYHTNFEYWEKAQQWEKNRSPDSKAKRNAKNVYEYWNIPGKKEHTLAINKKSRDKIESKTKRNTETL